MFVVFFICFFCFFFCFFFLLSPCFICARCKNVIYIHIYQADAIHPSIYHSCILAWTLGFKFCTLTGFDPDEQRQYVCKVLGGSQQKLGRIRGLKTKAIGNNIWGGRQQKLGRNQELKIGVEKNIYEGVANKNGETSGGKSRGAEKAHECHKYTNISRWLYSCHF